jgi:hypothetical protein
MQMMLALYLVWSMGASSDTWAEIIPKQQHKNKATRAQYQNYGPYTDPGEYVNAFDDLPKELEALCTRIKAQFIHPIADLPKYRHCLPEGRVNEDQDYPTVKALLAGLQARDPRGIVADRPPEDRLVVSCRYHALLLAAILKYRGIPVRIRYGFASYLAPGRHIYHVICEVWNSEEKRWMLVDPDRNIVDFPRTKFAFAWEVWQQYRQDNLNPAFYGVADWWGPHPILDVLCHDMTAVLGHEHIYWEHPPVSSDPQIDVAQLPDEQLEVLNQLAILLQTPELHHQELQLLYNSHQFLQFPERQTQVNKKK